MTTDMINATWDRALAAATAGHVMALRAVLESATPAAPIYTQLIPVAVHQIASANDRIAADGALLGEMLVTAGKHADSAIVRILLQSPSAPCRLDWHGGEAASPWRGIGVVMPMFVKWDDQPV